jgi:hypothetical protein
MYCCVDGKNYMFIVYMQQEAILKNRCKNSSKGKCVRVE